MLKQYLQVPNQTLKIQSKDGSVFVYNLSEVLKITKEPRFANPIQTQPTQILDKQVEGNQAVNNAVIDTINSTPKNSYTYNTPTDKKVYLKKGFIGVTEIGSLFWVRSMENYDNFFQIELATLASFFYL